jgi:divalent metal cation (Fe/Co/Zn/Cd) transporter
VLVDAAVLDPEAVSRVVERVPGVLAAGKVRSRSDGTRTSVDLVVRVDPELPTDAAHEIADRVEQALLDQCDADDVSVHVEPERR